MYKLIAAIAIASLGTAAHSAETSGTFVKLNDPFTAKQPTSSLWSSGGTGTVTTNNGEASFSCGSWLSTQGKVIFSGKKFTVESRMKGPGVLRDTVFVLVDINTGDRIQAGDTNYQSVGLYSYGSGAFNLPQSGNGVSVSDYREYRLTLTGTSLTLERGVTLNNVTETLTRTLSASVNNRVFYLLIGTGGPDYCPGVIDWVRVQSS